jgi:hypothetical protein
MIFHGSHNKKWRSEIKHKESVNHNSKFVNGSRKDCLRLRAFVSVGEALLFLFNASKVHHKSFKMITNWFGCVLLDFKNQTQLTALKTVERSSQNWLAKSPSSMASLHKNGFGFTILEHFSSFETL